MDLGLTSKIFLVAGSSRGIGKAIATTLLDEGARVCISGRDRAALLEAHRDLSKKGEVTAFEGDLTQPDSIRGAFDTVARDMGTLDGLVCNLGTGSGKTGWQAPEEDWERLFRLNLLGSMRLAQAAIPNMMERGGSIVFIASIAGVETTGAPLPYSAAKAALLNYSKNLSRQVATNNIRVNAVAPGNILFPGGSWEKHLAKDKETVLQSIRREVPMDRFGTPEEVASVTAFLCSARASFITGACVVVDGGQTRTI